MSQIYQSEPWGKLKPLTSSLEEILLTENPHLLPSQENGETSCRIYKGHMNQFWIERISRTLAKDRLLQQESPKNLLQKLLQAGSIICLSHPNSSLEDYIFEPIVEDLSSPLPDNTEHLCPGCKFYTLSKAILAPCLHSFCDTCVSQLKEGAQKCSVCCEEEPGSMSYSRPLSTGASESENSDSASTYLAELNGYYEGEWKGEKPHGNGKIVFCFGAIYEGEWKDGKPDGKGKLNHFFKYIYEGQWKDGKKDGEGKMTFFNGEFYEGGFNPLQAESMSILISSNFQFLDLAKEMILFEMINYEFERKINDKKKRIQFKKKFFEDFFLRNSILELKGLKKIRKKEQEDL